MTNYDFHQLVKQLVEQNETQRLAARMILFALDEQAVEPLIDQFYAGVSEPVGIAILEMLAEIGGPDALTILRSVYNFEVRESLRRAGARGLLRNTHNLDSDEKEELLRYIDQA